MALWIGLSLIIATIASSDARNWDGFKAIFQPPGGFVDLPQTSDAAASEGWVRVRDTAPVTGFNSVMFCKQDDPHVCIHYDRLDSRVVGFHFALVKDNLQQEYPYDSHPIFVKKTIFGSTCYVVTFFLVAPWSMSMFRSSNLGEGLWVQNGTRLVKLPDTEAQADREGLFQRKVCVKGMGMHYYYGLTMETDWTEFTPPFLLFENKKLVGCGVNTFGNVSKNTFWREDPPLEMIPQVLQVGPQFIPQIIANGWSSLHFYFVDHASTIGCEPGTELIPK